MHNLLIHELMIYCSCGLSVSLLVWSLYAINRDIYLEGQEELYQEPSFAFKLAIPYFRFVGRLAQIFFLMFKPAEGEHEGAITYIYTFYAGLSERIRKNIISAGLDWLWKPYEFIGAMFISGGVGVFFAVVIFIQWQWPIFLLFFPIVGFMTPYYLLNMTAYNRKRQIFKDLPFCLDLVCFYAEAGLDFTVAMERMVAELRPCPIREEFMKVVRQLKMGKSRSDAMHELGVRVNLPDLTAICGAIIHCDEMGSNLTHVLKVQSVALRFKRFRQAEEAAMKAPVKMLFPLLCFVFPTIFLVIFGPWIAKGSITE